MLRIALAMFGFGVALASPTLAPGDSRFAVIAELPWREGQALDVGRRAGGMLVQTGWHYAVFYFPEDVQTPDWSADTATIRIRGVDPMCGGA